MATRRELLKQAAATALATLSSSRPMKAENSSQSCIARTLKSPMNSRTVSSVRSLIRREETILRFGGDGHGYAMTWAADGRQLVAFCDGTSRPKDPKSRYLSSG